jgi:hypothetical protein
MTEKLRRGRGPKGPEVVNDFRILHFYSTHKNIVFRRKMIRIFAAFRVFKNLKYNRTSCLE